jgi:hypothetical protein
MILIYAAAEMQSRILEDAPSFFGKHLTYFKDKYPAYFTHMAADQDTQNEEQKLLVVAESKMLRRIKSLFATS